ncbi:uncharacterized protein METZ01_LOCUS277127, partial [marine metagenome]
MSSFLFQGASSLKYLFASNDLSTINLTYSFNCWLSIKDLILLILLLKEFKIFKSSGLKSISFGT